VGAAGHTGRTLTARKVRGYGFGGAKRRRPTARRRLIMSLMFPDSRLA
jgi:hypothetical protein